MGPVPVSRGVAGKERVRAALLGAVAALIPVFMTDARSGSAGLLAEAALLFGASMLLCRRSESPFRIGVLLMAGTLCAEMVALLAHTGFAIFAGTWAPAGAQLLVAVPAVLAGGAVGASLRRPSVGWVFCVIAVLVGADATMILGSSIVTAVIFLAAGSGVAGLMRPRNVLLLGSLIAGSAGLLAVVIFFARPAGPGNMWPVVLPVQAVFLAPMAYAGTALGMLLARVTGRGRGEAPART